MKISENSTVIFHYSVDVADEGIVDSTFDAEPLKAIFGTEQLIPTMEKEMIGLQAGDQHTFTLLSKDAFGELQEDAVTQIPKNNIELRKDIKIGMYMDIEDNKKNEYRGKIVAIDDENITMDFNHPLAGKTLNYKVEIIKVK